ncbi:uncharacterized protein LOC9641285 isoform X2 [Selaginella moellendorffii]|uniref:uncharacterized protein LOC9641285 isoform X2 n=1 Tax=Selaginella moellendorffii TaxID=88036 RepID=UPI000D1C3948|nr:uncharacterized protein LOC9641285 isoform X2 [Selaginella moellendorffii]|eukprot:XP_024531539.1 uncharacterized protein LOC9641285 isoform X2 [Selaginella moellendorffii]
MECRLLASASTWYFLSEKKDVLPQLLEPNRAGREEGILFHGEMELDGGGEERFLHHLQEWWQSFLLRCLYHLQCLDPPMKRSLYVDSQMAWQRLSHCKREALTGVSCTLTEKEDGGRQEGRRRADEAFPCQVEVEVLPFIALGSAE